MTEFIKPSLKELYNQVNEEIEKIRQNILKGNGAAGEDEISEEEKVALSVKNSREFRRLVYEKLGK